MNHEYRIIIGESRLYVRYEYVKHVLVLFFGLLFSGGRRFFSRFRLRSKQRAHWDITTHDWIPAELRGGTLSIRRR